MWVMCVWGLDSGIHRVVNQTTNVTQNKHTVQTHTHVCVLVVVDRFPFFPISKQKKTFYSQNSIDVSDDVALSFRFQVKELLFGKFSSLTS